MTELKTLKDFELAFNTGLSPASSQAFKELKQEAIKRIKELEIIKENDYKEWHKEAAHFIEGRIFEIKHFFNITEEELKGG